MVLFQGPVAYPFSVRFFQSDAEWDGFKRFLSGKLPVTHRVLAALINASNWLVWTLLLLSIAIMIFYIFLQENNE